MHFDRWHGPGEHRNGERCGIRSGNIANPAMQKKPAARENVFHDEFEPAFVPQYPDYD